MALLVDEIKRENEIKSNTETDADVEAENKRLINEERNFFADIPHPKNC